MNNIGWCTVTKNPLVGCSPASEGCANCWAAKDVWIRQHNRKSPHYEKELTKSSGVWSGKIEFYPHVLDQVRSLKAGERVFMPSMSDLFHSAVREEWIEEIIQVIHDRPDLTFITLTKRPQRMLEFIASSCYLANAPLRNWWIGTSIENQRTADERVPLLQQLGELGYTTVVSAEPLLEKVVLLLDHISWVIIGGESGHNARPFNLAWGANLLHQCKEAGVAAYMKQVGSNPIIQMGEGAAVFPWSHKIAGKGDDPAQWIEGLGVRQFPDQALEVIS